MWLFSLSCSALSCLAQGEREKGGRQRERRRASSRRGTPCGGKEGRRRRLNRVTFSLRSHSTKTTRSERRCLPVTNRTSRCQTTTEGRKGRERSDATLSLPSQPLLSPCLPFFRVLFLSFVTILSLFHDSLAFVLSQKDRRWCRSCSLSGPAPSSS